MEAAKEKFIVLGPCVWGKGESPADALSKAPSAEGDISGWVCKKLPDGAKDVHVDEMGSICWTWVDGANKTAVCERVEFDAEFRDGLYYAASEALSDARKAMGRLGSLRPEFKDLLVRLANQVQELDDALLDYECEVE